MGAGVDIGVDPERHAGALAPVLRQTVEELQLRQGFDVELLDVRLEPGDHLAGALADPGEDDALGRDARRQRPAHLALRDDIGPGAQPREGGDHRLVGIGLQRVADGGARAVEGADEGLIALDQGGRGIAIERGSDGRSQPVERHLFGMKGAAPIGKITH